MEAVTGSAKYTADMSFDQMLYAGILRSPYPHARILSIDAGKAMIPGVRAVLTPKDMPRIPFNSAWRGDFHLDQLPADEFLLTEEARFVGDKIMALAADDPAIIDEALQHVEVEYKVLPPVFSPEEALRPEAPKIHLNGNIAAKAAFNIGDVEEGFRESDHVFEGQYETQRVQHVPLETHGCIADFDYKEKKLTVWSSTQVPYNVRYVLSKALAMPTEKIRVVMPFVGGGFGSKDEMADEALCALLSMKTGRPVKSQYTRGEDMRATVSRHPSQIWLKTGVSKNGSLVAKQMKAVFNTGAYSTAGPSVMKVAGVRWATLYKAPNVSFEGIAVYTNSPVAGAFRGYGNPQSNFANEVHMDEIAAELGLDPIEFRLKNAVRAGDIDPVNRYQIPSCGLEECVRKGVERMGWGEKKGRRNGRGVGVAFNCHATGAKPAIPERSMAKVVIDGKGVIHVYSAAADIGQGSRTVFAQICAEELGIDIDKVRVHVGDTGTAPFDFGTYASRTTSIAGYAVKLAALDAKAKLLEKASRLLNINRSDLVISDGVITAKTGLGEKMDYHAVFGDSNNGEDVIIGMGEYEPPGNSLSFTAQFAEIEVNRETGRVKVLRCVTATDCGRAINPLGAEGQIHGGVAQGIGFALYEEMVVDDGVVLNPDFRDYKCLSPKEAPEIEAILVETIDPSGPYGAKGLGEPSLVSVAPAIANAVYDAIGVRICSLPITPEKVLKALCQTS